MEQLSPEHTQHAHSVARAFMVHALAVLANAMGPHSARIREALKECLSLIMKEAQPLSFGEDALRAILTSVGGEAFADAALARAPIAAVPLTPEQKQLADLQAQHAAQLAHMQAQIDALKAVQPPQNPPAVTPEQRAASGVPMTAALHPISNLEVK